MKNKNKESKRKVLKKLKHFQLTLTLKENRLIIKIKSNKTEISKLLKMTLLRMIRLLKKIKNNVLTNVDSILEQILTSFCYQASVQSI